MAIFYLFIAVTPCTGLRAGTFWPGMFIDEDISIDFQQETTPNDVVTVIATLPLTSNEQWHKMSANHYLLFQDGESIAEKSI